MSISTCGSFGKARSFFGKGTKLHVPEAPLTPQTSDNESDEEREREAASASSMQSGEPEEKMMQPMDLVISEKRDKPEEDKPARVSVIMKGNSDGTFEPANIFGRTGAEEEQQQRQQQQKKKDGNNVGGRFEKDPSKNFPAPEEPPSRKTDGSEMTSGHRDKNIPMTGGAMALSGDAHSSPNRIATTSRVPVLISESPNLHHSANSKKKFKFKTIKIKLIFELLINFF